MRTRTADLLITSELLYQLSYTSSWKIIIYPGLFCSLRSQRLAGAIIRVDSGAWGRNRTTDTMIFSHVLYQLSYPGTKLFPLEAGRE